MASGNSSPLAVAARTRSQTLPATQTQATSSAPHSDLIDNSIASTTEAASNRAAMRSRDNATHASQQPLSTKKQKSVYSEMEKLTIEHESAPSKGDT